MQNLNTMMIIVPLIIIQLVLFISAIIHIFNHKNYRIGNRIIWVLICFINFIGPISYFVFGRER